MDDLLEDLPGPFTVTRRYPGGVVTPTEDDPEAWEISLDGPPSPLHDPDADGSTQIMTIGELITQREAQARRRAEEAQALAREAAAAQALAAAELEALRAGAALQSIAVAGIRQVEAGGVAVAVAAALALCLWVLF